MREIEDEEEDEDDGVSALCECPRMGGAAESEINPEPWLQNSRGDATKWTHTPQWSGMTWRTADAPV
jgi:hypothetical protein